MSASWKISTWLAQRRAGQIRQQTELQRLGDALASLVRRVGDAGEVAHLVVASSEVLEPYEREREFGATAAWLRGDQHVHLRVLAVDHVVQIPDLLPRDNGNIEGAENSYRRSLEMRQRLLGPEHPNIATSLNNVSGILHKKGDLDEAEVLQRASLDMDQKLLGDEHPEVATGINNLATLLHDKGDLEEAEALYREALQMSRRLLGDSHPDVGNSLNNLASLLLDHEKDDEAEVLYRESLAIARQALGERHPTVVNALANLGGLMHDRQRWEDAESLYLQALDIELEALGADHIEVGRSYDALAALHEARNDYAGTEPYHPRSWCTRPTTIRAIGRSRSREATSGTACSG